MNLADYNLAHLPEGMSLEAGVMLPDMLSTGFMGAENARIGFGSTVAVLGIGPVGLSAVAGAGFGSGEDPLPAGPAAVKVAAIRRDGYHQLQEEAP